MLFFSLHLMSTQSFKKKGRVKKLMGHAGKQLDHVIYSHDKHVCSK